MLARSPGLWEAGASKFSWWPDWRGKPCAIIASGPSAKQVNIAALRGRMAVIAIKENVELAPWADVVYGCDVAWWRNQIGLPKYQGLKIAAAPALSAMYPDIRIVEVDCRCHLKGGQCGTGAARPCDVIRTDSVGRIGSGGNSGFQALNLAIQWGATKILFIGLDVTDRYGVHWYGRANGNGRSNPCEDNFRRWRTAFARTQATLAALGVEVVSASAISTLTCFRKTTIERVIEAWT